MEDQSYIAETCSAQFHPAFSNCTEKHATKFRGSAQDIPSTSSGRPMTRSEA
jgi:hypothetical protein